MDHAAEIRKQPASAAPPPRTPAAAAAEAAAYKNKKPTTTLLDAYEIECIRRELQRLVLKHNHQTAAAGGDEDAAASTSNARGHRCRHNEHLQLPHQRVSSSTTKKAMSAKRVSPSPSPSLPPPASQTAGPKKKGRGGVRLLGRHAVAICSGTAPVAAGAPVSGRGRRAVAICSGTAAPTVARSTVGVGGRRRPRGGFREVEKV